MNNEGHSRCHKALNLGMFIQPVSGKEGDGLLMFIVWGLFGCSFGIAYSFFWVSQLPNYAGFIAQLAGCHL